nr:cytochrome c3 family protein [uncultured Desulfuromonas sp.]
MMCSAHAKRLSAGALLLFSLLFYVPLCFGEITAVPLTDADCIKCHHQPSVDIRDHGGAHRDDMGCLGCHENHPPLGDAVIPECSDCHSGDDHKHFALDDCSSCHNPHAPGINDLSALDEPKSACLSCHEDVGTAMEQTPSLHAEQQCNDCHNEHGTDDGQFSTCIDCHDKHSPDMTYQDCLGCHQPHAPTIYLWNEDTPADQCAACHEDQVSELSSKGEAHGSDIHCSDCHSAHPPHEEGVIPACADCHAPSDHPHYKLDNCVACHRPHAPLEIDLTAVSPIKPVCISCHEAPQQEMHQWPSAHGDMDCNECHQEHGDAMSCLDCHDGHNDSMSYRDCLRCHQPHSPLALRFSQAGIKSDLCGSCHRGQLKQLSGNTTGHADVQCVFCHRRTHKVILTCDNCHGEPHDSSIHQHFTDCAQCHNGPHNLKN